MTRWSQTAYSYFKGSFGKKYVTFMKAGDNIDLIDILNNAAVPTGNANLDYCGLKNLVYSATFKNVSTYQLRFRVTTWKAKHDLQVGDQPNDFESWYIAGFNITQQVGICCLIRSLVRVLLCSMTMLRPTLS